MTISEIGGSLNVTDSLNVARQLSVKGDLEVTGNIRVQGVAYLPSVEVPSTGGEDSATAESVAALSTRLDSEITSRKNADTTLESAIGMVRIDAAGAQNVANKASSKADEAVASATAAAESAESVRQRVESLATVLRRATAWWLFPVADGLKAVTTDGVSTVTFAKEGFRFCAGDIIYLIAPPLSAGISISFTLGEVGYLCINLTRLFRLDPDQRVSVAAVMEKVTSPSLIHPASHIPVAYCIGGQTLRLLGRFAEVFGSVSL